MLLKHPIAALVLCACASLAAPVQAFDDVAASTAAAAPAQAFDLERDVNRVLKTFDVPGIAIAIVKDGKVLAAQGFGVRKLGDPAPVTGKTLFEIASNSKAFTAVALAQLVDEGKLKWDDPVIMHLPDFRMYDAYVTQEMTIRDLLTHRSGLGLGAGDLLWWPTTTFSTDEIIHNLRYVKPATSFRASYAYDNLLYIVAGRIIAQKTGKSWGDAVRERILAPLGMTGTTTSVAAMLRAPDYSAPHSRINGRQSVVKPMPVENAIGAVGIDTNAEDIAKWMNALLAGGELANGQRLFSAAQGKEIWTPVTPMKIAEPKPALAATKANFNAYGLGFNIRDYRGKKLVLHGGALQGFYSRVLMVPEEKLGVAIFTNAENSGSMTALQWRILDHYLGAAPTDWIGIIAAQEQEEHRKELEKVGKAVASRAAASKPSLPRAAYDGEYTDPWYGKVVIRHDGARQIVSFTRTPDLTGELEHFQHDTFIVRWKERNFNADAYLTFALNPDGSIERAKMAAVSAETDFSYDFHDLVLTPVKAGQSAQTAP
ncbi:CubicO group peptidase (beta-lactamase class C family) [Pseudoduganella flava]|uniref:CubicO group peptidase (Beta-lactamase class C family) n=1 Tax=Pseudoduganella flava TaxID=871742 RepID=A0A562P8M6_9BURK|nr:serine hydrolase [Pseudoduganella flava]QGZ40771.1 serine hydrolase [Pseudoduganella flava]TWI40761.1 CubicO group peptidase (beta-lactamase class C family) [Pseudoduganella flava]